MNLNLLGQLPMNTGIGNVSLGIYNCKNLLYF